MSHGKKHNIKWMHDIDGDNPFFFQELTCCLKTQSVFAQTFFLICIFIAYLYIPSKVQDKYIKTGMLVIKFNSICQ